MSTSESKQNQSIELTFDEVSLQLSAAVQKSIYGILKDYVEAANKAEFGVQDLGYCFGSAIGSTLFEVISSNDSPMSVEQRDVLLQCLSRFGDGYADKLAILGSTESLKEATTSTLPN